ncbi:MAG: hypoxanthine phosphoribosyltransferase [Dehalococcoidia bacterium]
MKRILSRRQMRQTIKRLSDRIREDFRGERPLLVCVLKGAFVFLADLIRELDTPLEVDFITVSSYGSGRTSSGEVRIIQDITTDITGRHVLLVEDIVDSGLTLDRLRQHLLSRSPASLRVCALLARRDALADNPDIADYIGHAVPPGFVVGYGIDSGEDYRYLPDIWMLEDE